MSAYVIVDVKVEDPERYEKYKSMTLATLEPFGGRFVTRGGHAENLEGDWEPNRIVIVEFESVKKAKEWWSSDIYSEPKALRQSAATTRMIVVDGV